MTTYGARPVRDRWSNARLEALDDDIIDVLADEHPATLRSVFYRVASVGSVDKSDAGYRRVARQVLKLRRSGILPYAWVTDGTRYYIGPEVHTSLNAAVEGFQAAYRRDLWADQPVHVEVFTEKDAITGTIRPVTERWGLPIGVLRGYTSESFAYSVAMGYRRLHRPVVVLHLGDHDPSGVHALEDFTNKVLTFVDGATPVEFVRVAVTPDQIAAWDLPTRPTKRTDTRSAGFVGDSVEVDAIPPTTLRAHLTFIIETYVDPARLEVTRAAEESEREILGRIMEVARGT